MGGRDFGNRRDGESPYSDRKSDREKSSGAKTKTAGMAKYRYGIDADLDELRQIQRIERSYGVRRLKGWLGEGMPYEAMGNPHTMRRFRERTGTPVPWNAEQHNQESLQRSQRAAADDSPAGQTGVPDSVREVIASPGQSLDPSIQRTMEDRMGESFGDVRVHTGPQAAAACDSINARAFTVGNHVAFDRGEYDPGSAEGQHVIAHELAHVRQQQHQVASKSGTAKFEKTLNRGHRKHDSELFDSGIFRTPKGQKIPVQRVEEGHLEALGKAIKNEEYLEGSREKAFSIVEDCIKASNLMNNLEAMYTKLKLRIQEVQMAWMSYNQPSIYSNQDDNDEPTLGLSVVNSSTFPEDMKRAENEEMYFDQSLEDLPPSLQKYIILAEKIFQKGVQTAMELQESTNLVSQIPLTLKTRDQIGEAIPDYPNFLDLIADLGKIATIPTGKGPLYISGGEIAAKKLWYMIHSRVHLPEEFEDTKVHSHQDVPQVGQYFWSEILDEENIRETKLDNLFEDLSLKTPDYNYIEEQSDISIVDRSKTEESTESEQEGWFSSYSQERNPDSEGSSHMNSGYLPPVDPTVTYLNNQVSISGLIGLLKVYQQSDDFVFKNINEDSLGKLEEKAWKYVKRLNILHLAKKYAELCLKMSYGPSGSHNMPMSEFRDEHHMYDVYGVLNNCIIDIEHKISTEVEQDVRELPIPGKIINVLGLLDNKYSMSDDVFKLIIGELIGQGLGRIDVADDMIENYFVGYIKSKISSTSSSIIHSSITNNGGEEKSDRSSNPTKDNPFGPMSKTRNLGPVIEGLLTDVDLDDDSPYEVKHTDLNWDQAKTNAENGEKENKIEIMHTAPAPDIKHIHSDKIRLPTHLIENGIALNKLPFDSKNELVKRVKRIMDNPNAGQTNQNSHVGRKYAAWLNLYKEMDDGSEDNDDQQSDGSKERNDERKIQLLVGPAGFVRKIQPMEY